MPLFLKAWTGYILLQPVLLYSKFADKRAAAANNAILAPHVRKSAFAVIQEIASSNRTAYLGYACHPIRFVREGYILGIMFKSSLHSLLGDGVFNADGEMWNVGSLKADLPYPSSKSSVTQTSYENHPSTIFVKAFTEGQSIGAQRTTYGYEWPLTESWKDAIKPYRKIMDGFTEPLRWTLHPRKARMLRMMKKTTYLHISSSIQGDTKISKDELVNLLIAGRDTLWQTMCLLTFAFYMLCEHPDIEKRLRNEVFELVGPRGRPTYDHMREMKFMRAFINEVLRLYPSVGISSLDKNLYQSRGLALKSPNSKPIYSPAKARTDLWGPDALQFDPDRFLDERVHKYLTPNPFIFCPFNAGPRICLGQQFAYHEATFFLVRLLQQFTGFALNTSENKQPPAEWAECPGRLESRLPQTPPLLYLWLVCGIRPGDSWNAILNSGLGSVSTAAYLFMTCSVVEHRRRVLEDDPYQDNESPSHAGLRQEQPDTITALKKDHALYTRSPSDLLPGIAVRDFKQALAREQLDVAIPAWLMITAVLLTRPALFVSKRYYTRFSEARAAAANNAILAPHVRESAIHIITAFGASIKDGYPVSEEDDCDRGTPATLLLVELYTYFQFLFKRPMDSRVPTKGVVWPAKAPGSKPIYVPEGTTTDLWDPDAHKFDPDRFLDERVHKYLTPNPFIFCPFNAGSRICLGQQFAYHEATFFLVRLLQQFTGFKLEKSENIQPPADWAKCSGLKGTDKVVPAMHLTLYVKGGMWVRMEELKVADVL
ncbi:cytochrome P450 [Crassisporium funariophilum]|nr:cytochrome P450 [Crassisporium funariophilum]